MKPELKMSDAKDSISDGPVVLTQMVSSPEPRKRNTKKYLIIGGSVILLIAVVLIAILVGMYLFTKGQNDLLKYSLNMDKDTKQDMTVDVDDNSIEYHTYSDKYETWSVDDFNKDIHTVKVKTSSGTNCYIGPLNRTSIMDPSQIKVLPNMPSDTNATQVRRLVYDISGTPVADSSFLGKKARDMCKGTSVYWVYPRCDDPGTAGLQRKKRCYRYCYYGSWYYCTVNGYLSYCRNWVCNYYC